jgi:uncharacterized protein YacL
MRNVAPVKLSLTISFPIYLLLLLFSSILVGIILGGIINLPLLAYETWNSNEAFWWTMAASMIASLFLLIIFLHLLKKQNYHLQADLKNTFTLNYHKMSYAQFLWIALIFSPFFLIWFQNLDNKSIFEPPSGILSILLSVCLLALFLMSNKGKKPEEPLRFAAGATNNDGLGYQKAACEDMQSIINSKQHMIVASINGRLGEGKSSYLRMMMESQPQENYLYSFISLTETNETKTFSILFAERWAKALTTRYPIY